MVLPLIPLALIAAGAVSGSGGLALGGKGALDIKNARDKKARAWDRYQRRRTLSEAKVAETNRLLEEYGAHQKRALTDVVVRMADFLRRHANQVREHERLLVDGIDAEMTRVSGLTGLDFDTVSWVKGALGSAAVGTGMSSGVFAAAGALGSASTGTAISSLSGVAAENATLALLGGGSLVSGGGGIALGATALNFVAIGPGLLVGGFVVHGQGNKAKTKAAAFSAKITVEIAKLDELDTKLSAVDAELSSLLCRLRKRAVAALDLLEAEPFDPEAHAARFQHALMLTVAVRDVVAAPIIDANGELTEQSANVTVKYRPMVEEDNVA